jgi:hypothetical protein
VVYMVFPCGLYGFSLWLIWRFIVIKMGFRCSFQGKYDLYWFPLGFICFSCGLYGLFPCGLFVLLVNYMGFPCGLYGFP